MEGERRSPSPSFLNLSHIELESSLRKLACYPCHSVVIVRNVFRHSLLCTLRGKPPTANSFLSSKKERQIHW